MADINIDTAAAKAASVTNDGVTVTQRSLPDLIAADKYQRSRNATDDPVAMLKAMQLKLVSPGGH
jgi:hypothetical protein